MRVTEAKYAVYREVELAQISFRHTFDLKHVKFLHHWLFQDVYVWAGKVRNVSLIKDASLFAQPRYIEPMAATIFKQFASEGRLIDVPCRDLAVRLAYYFGELNALHPFREGNGRTQRLFWRQVLALRGLAFNWDGVSREEMAAASAAVHGQTDEPLRQLIGRIIEPI